MKLDVDKINYCVHNFEEENFDDFDLIYDYVMTNKIKDFEKGDIIGLCDIFKVPFEEIHPFQYMKIYRIIFWLVNRIGIENGFKLLVEGLCDVEDKYSIDIFNMLLNSYDDEAIMYFKSVFEESDLNSNEVLRKILN